MNASDRNTGVANVLHEANMRQHFSDNLNGPVPNGFVLCYESLEEVTEHSRHEAVGDGVFFLVPTFPSNFLIGCWLVRLVNAQVWAK